MRIRNDVKYGTGYAIGAYAIWGFFPIYWKWLQDVPALQLVSHRILWTSVILCGFIALSGQWQHFISGVRKPGAIKVYLTASLLMSVNWLVFVMAVNTGHVTETSLGYFISPLINVLMGVILLHERLGVWQWFSIALASTGVLCLTFTSGSLPWMAIVLAFSFGTYGLFKKIASLGSLHGLALETVIVFPLAILYLGYCDFTDKGVFFHTGTVSTLLLIGTGLLSMSPLLLFASAAQRIPLSRLGILQYITPTLQFLLATLVYDEPFTRSTLIGFSLVWIALLTFGASGYLRRREENFALCRK